MRSRTREINQRRHRREKALKTKKREAMEARKEAKKK